MKFKEVLMNIYLPVSTVDVQYMNAYFNLGKRCNNNHMIILMELLKFTDLLSGCASFSCKYIVHYLVYRGIKIVSVSLPMLIIIF